MKILFVGTINRSDGSSKRMVPLLSHLILRGHQLRLLVYSDDYLYLKEKINAPVHLLKDKEFHPRNSIEQESKLFIRSLFFTNKILKSFNADIIYGFNTMPHSGGVAWIYSKIFKKTFVLEFSDLVMSSSKNIFKRKIGDVLQKIIPKGADKIIATPFLKDFCLRLGISPKKISVIPCGADVNQFNKRQKDKKLIKQYGLEGTSVILYAGALFKIYGIQDLIHAFSLVIKKNPKIKLLLVGDSEEVPDLKRIVKLKNMSEQVIFTGKQPYERIPDFINVADICINPFPKSQVCLAGSPVKVFESLSCGIPVIHSDLESVREIVINDKTGLTYKAGNIKDMARKINYLIENSEKRIEFGENGRKLILKNYSWDILGDKLINAMEESLNNIGGV